MAHHVLLAMTPCFPNVMELVEPTTGVGMAAPERWDLSLATTKSLEPASLASGSNSS